MPFCGERCQVVDLGRWLGEKHGIPTVRSEEDESSEPVVDDDQYADPASRDYE